MRYILLLLSTYSILAAATGDPLDVTVRSDGWTAEIELEGMVDGGAYDFGFGASNNPAAGTPKIVFTVESPSFDDSGDPTTLERTVYGTIEVRKPAPDEALNEEVEAGGNVTVRIALSEYIYDEDTVTGVDILAGFYDDGPNANTAAADFAVTNSSVAVFQGDISNWSWPGYQRMDSSTKLRALAFHRHGRQGKPVRAVEFTVTDGTTTNSEIVLGMSRDMDFGDLIPVVEYVTTTDLTAGLTQGAELTCNFTVYPWVGESSSTSTGAAAPSPLRGPIKGVCDRTGAYGITHAVVDPVSGTDPAVGSDSGKWVGNGSDHGDGTGKTAYLTVARAARAIRDYNNTVRSPSRDDVGAGEIYVKAGSFNSFGATISGGYGSTPKTWLTIKPFTGVARNDVVLIGSSGNTDISDRVKLEGIKINTTTGNTFSGCLAMWLHDCDLNATAAGTWTSAGQVVWVTQGRVGEFTQGFKAASSATNMAFALVRGVDLTGFNGSVMPYTFIGNKRAINAVGGPTFIGATATTQAAPKPVPIFAYNELYGYDVSSGLAMLRFAHLNEAFPTSMAFVQNILEVTNGANGGTGNIASSEGSAVGNTPIDNVIWWHNLCVGARMQFAYNSEGAILKHRRYWSVRSNYWDISGTKSDTFGTDNGARVGNWPVLFGVGSSDNVNGNIESVSSVVFDYEFFGLNSLDNGMANDDDYVEFVDRRSRIGGNAGLGVGNYRLTAGTPLNDSAKLDWQVPYDLDGNLRDATNTATGPYVYGTALGGSGDFPVVTITAPADSSTQGSPVNFTATATDTEDGNIAANVVWTSDLDGSLGTGASINVSLSTGTHEITATVTDSDTNSDNDSITLTVSAPSADGTINATRVNAGTVTIQ
jgi:hypothetical protein